MILNSFLTLALYYEGIINIPINDTILTYIFFHDIFKQTVLFILSILGIYSLDFIFDKEILCKALTVINGNSKKKFYLLIMDIVILFFISSLSVVTKLGDVNELTSFDKFESIWYSAIFILVIKFLIWFSKVTIGVQLLHFLDVLLMFLRLPIDIFDNFVKEIDMLPLSNQVKKAIKGVLFLICSAMFIYTLYMTIFVSIDTFRNFGI